MMAICPVCGLDAPDPAGRLGVEPVESVIASWDELERLGLARE